MRRTRSILVTSAVLVIIAAFTGCGRGYDAEKTDTSTSGGETAERWQCPMHPQIVSDKPGKCPICSMPLVKMSTKTTSSSANGPKASDGQTIASGSKKVLYWFDPMQPDVHFDHPGKSPSMNMEMVPKYADAQGGGEASAAGVVELAADAQQAAGVQTTRVERKNVAHILRVVGTIETDERKLVRVSSRVAGRLDRLFVNFTGQAVRKGEPLFQIYSPDLVASEREYLLALENRARARTSSDASYVASAEGLVRASRDRLRLWGVPDHELQSVAASGQPQTDLTFRSPVTGTVLEKSAVEGQYVKEGDPLYVLADLSDVWLYMQVYEYELSGVKIGQRVTTSVTSLPGRAFNGQVRFIYPVIDPATRTARVRVELANADATLRPGMFANAELKVDLGSQLALPKSAVLDTGTRQLVYVRTGKTTFQPREVKVGGKAGDTVSILSGLAEGEEVVTAGNFLIDSQSQLAGGASVQWSGASEVKKASAAGEEAPK